MSKLYLECYSGISGDMTVGALLDLGADRQVLEEALASVPAEGFDIRISTVQKSGINACDFDVILEHDNHDHDMAYLFGNEAPEHHDHEHTHDHGHEHDHSHHHEEHPEHDHDAVEHAHGENGTHDHEHEHNHEHHHNDEHEHNHDHHHYHDHVHRSLKDVMQIIEGTKMTDGAKEIAVRIFRIVAEAEAAVHGKSIDEVHFHEVGAVDSIVDIISIAVCYDNLASRYGITDVIVPVLYDGQGTIRCQHGIIPVPVPAVTSIAGTHHLRFHIMNEQGEFVTPTGAAAVAALRTSDRLPEEFTVLRVGLGAGKRDYKRAGVVRALLIEG